MIRQLKCIFANINSLVSRSKKHQFRLFLDEHRPDVVMLAEHRLSAHQNLVMEGYNIFIQKRRQGPGRGTAILTRDTFRSELVNINTGIIENSCVKLFRTDGSSLHFVSLYCRPADVFEAADLEPLRHLASEGELLIGADLNARHINWGGNTICSRGRMVYDFILGCPDLIIVPTGGPTRISRDSSTYIDICIASLGISIDDNSGLGLSTIDCNSDHLAIVMQVHGIDPEHREKRKIFNYKK